MKILTLLALMLVLATSPYASDHQSAAWRMIDSGALVIDVRTTKEYAQGHLSNAIHIPYRQIVAQLKHLEMRKDRPIVLYCLSGGRAGIAEEALEKEGYSQVVNGGGLEDLVRD